PLHFLAKILIFSNNDDEPNTFNHWNKEVRPNTRFYLLSLDFNTPELSQTELNRFFWLISDDPKSGEEPKKIVSVHVMVPDPFAQRLGVMVAELFCFFG
ncbi:MAG: hypothetical protein Q8R70_02400, partial [Methanoregula sp.]|nr:hypothetical protein [Methanoregula sp.]